MREIRQFDKNLYSIFNNEMCVCCKCLRDVFRRDTFLIKSEGKRIVNIDVTNDCFLCIKCAIEHIKKPEEKYANFKPFFDSSIEYENSTYKTCERCKQKRQSYCFLKNSLKKFKTCRHCLLYKKWEYSQDKRRNTHVEIEDINIPIPLDVENCFHYEDAVEQVEDSPCPLVDVDSATIFGSFIGENELCKDNSVNNVEYSQSPIFCDFYSENTLAKSPVINNIVDSQIEPLSDFNICDSGRCTPLPGDSDDYYNFSLDSDPIVFVDDLDSFHDY